MQITPATHPLASVETPTAKRVDATSKINVAYRSGYAVIGVKAGTSEMSADRALFFLHQMMWTALLVAAPILLGTLIVGVIISILQVATQLQEITLSYVPKLLTAAILLLLFGGWMLGEITQFAASLYHALPTLAHG
ncbi:MAG: flagellar biosynthetic protein FliQ [Terricaulis sp.]